MSRRQLARTPDNFPRMKHRAAGRLLRKRGHGKMTLPEAINVFAAVGKFVNDAVDALIYAFEGVARAFTTPPTKADFALLPGPSLTFDGMLRDAKGRALVDGIIERKRAQS